MAFESVLFAGFVATVGILKIVKVLRVKRSD